MNWVLVFIAGLLEVVWASSLKHADSLIDWIIIFILIAISFILLIRSYQKSRWPRHTLYLSESEPSEHISPELFWANPSQRRKCSFSYIAGRYFRNEAIYERKHITAGR